MSDLAHEESHRAHLPIEVASRIFKVTLSQLDDVERWLGDSVLATAPLRCHTYPAQSPRPLLLPHVPSNLDRVVIPTHVMRENYPFPMESWVGGEPKFTQSHGEMKVRNREMEDVLFFIRRSSTGIFHHVVMHHHGQ